MLQGLGALTRLAAQAQGQWLSWVVKACLAAGAAFVAGMATLGLPGGVFVELATALGRKIPADGAWPLAIAITAVGSALIAPASLVVRLVRPGMVGWPHVWATASITLPATMLFALYASSDLSATQDGPDSLASLTFFEITPERPRIAVGSGLHQFTLHFSAGDSNSTLLFNYPSDNNGMVLQRDVQPGQGLRFDPQYSGASFLRLQAGDYVLMRNRSGYFMQLKIVSVTSKGQPADMRGSVVFEYTINEGKWPAFKPL